MRRWSKRGAGLAVGLLVVSACTSTHPFSSPRSVAHAHPSSSTHPIPSAAADTTTTETTPPSTASPSTTALPAPSTGPADPGTSAAVDATLAAKLLTLADLDQDGDDWTVHPLPSSTSSRGCLAGVQPLSNRAKAAAEFTDGGGLPSVYEELALPVAPAPQVFARTVSLLSACTDPAIVDAGQSYIGTMSSIDIDPEGDQSAAYEVDVTIDDYDIVDDLAVVRKGDTLMVVQLTDVDDVDADQLQDLVEQALAKLG
jgi:hypothetical protein